ncbi:MAG: hypothetical protein AAGB19_08665 [Cyanobacteria bacterium P01_F01_bin.3]
MKDTPHIDPHPQWLEDYRQALADFDAASTGPDGGDGNSPAENEAYERYWSYCRKICETQPTTTDGVIAQLTLMVEHFADISFGNVIDKLDLQLVQNALAGLQAAHKET